jgi:hypothetical protein
VPTPDREVHDVSRSLKRALQVLVPAGLALALYLPTWSPVITWAHSGEDGPELEAVGRTLGVAHPSGYPLLTLLVRAVSVLVPPPVSALNVVTLLAALAAVAAVAAAGRALGARLRLGDGVPVETAGLVGAALFAVSLTWWRQSVIGEVYPLHLAIIASALGLVWAGGARRSLLAAWILGLGLAHHLQTVPFLLVIAAYLLLSGRFKPRLAVVACLIAPLSLYLVPVLRARSHPALNWGDPETLRNLWWSISGAQYRGNLFAEGPAPVLARWGDAALRSPVEQLGWGGAILGLVGLLVVARKAPREAATLALLYFGTTFTAAAYAIPDSAAYHLPAILALALAAGAGGAWILAAGLRAARRGGRLALAPAGAVLGALLAVVAVQAVRAAPLADARHDRGAYEYARDAVAALPPNALVLSHGDGRTFSLWYAVTVLDPRPDVVILCDNLLDWPWYRESLRAQHPRLPLPPTGLSRPILRGAIFERFLDERPVFTTEIEPELQDLFTGDPAGPLFRVRRLPRAGAEATIAGASSGTTRKGSPDPSGTESRTRRSLR